MFWTFADDDNRTCDADEHSTKPTNAETHTLFRMMKKGTNPKCFRKKLSILSEYKGDSWNKFFKLTKSSVP